MAAPTVKHLFWDSCVFAAFLRDETAIYDVASIAQFLDEARRDGRWVIHTSTIVSAEVLPSHIVKPNVGSFEEFLEDFAGAVVTIDPNPNVMRLSGQLRDLPYKKGGSDKRRLSTPDAIFLASAIHLQEAYGVQLHKFHTFDKGGKKDLDGNKNIPLIGYETWCEGFDPAQIKIAKRVIDLDRCKPDHPAPHIPGLVTNA